MNRYFLDRRGEDKCFPILSCLLLPATSGSSYVDCHFMVWRDWSPKKFKHLYQVPTASRWESRDFNTSESKTHTPNRQAVLPCTKRELRRLQSSLGIPWGIDLGWGWGEDPFLDIEILGCSSPLLKMAYLHIGYSRVCLHMTFAWIEHSAQCMTNSCFAYWNFVELFF